ncbi:MAG: efflux RND transporter permease subunit [Ignavibacteriaceae bacterium]|nr:efflux RND transporter permease subunit [Ignavibacteriaceae bacterium]
MKITDVAIDNRTSVFVLIFIIFILGVVAYVSLPREAAPDVKIPLVIVSTPYFGVAPEDIESLVTQPIEKELKKINDVKKIESSSFQGYSLIQVEFQSGTDLDEALQKVRDKVNKAESDIPADAEKPEIVEINFSEFPILTMQISGPTGLAKLKDLAEDLKDDIENIKGVLEVKTRGGLEREVQVDVDFTKLQHFNLRFDDITAAIRDENKTIPGGSVDVNNSTFLVRVPGEFKKPYPIEDLIVKIKDGSPIYLRDVATLTYGFKERASYAYHNGEESVSLQVSKRVGENIIEIANEVKALIAKKKEELPSNIEIAIITDASKQIAQQVTELENNIYSGLVLIIGVLFVALGFRNAVFVGISVPLSMLISFFILQLLGITLNFVVLFALILALGMLVDNAIVIIENIQKFYEEGNSVIDSAKLGTAEVAWPVATSTLTTLAAFFPLMFWPGVVGDFMSYVPLTVIVTLASSLFVALLINPVIAAKFMKLETKGKPERPTKFWHWLGYPFAKITYYFSEVLLPKVLEMYEKTLRFALGKEREPGQKISTRNWLGVVAFIALFVVEGILISFVPIWAEIIVTIVLATGVVLTFTNIRLKFVFGSFLALHLIMQFYGLLGKGVEFFPDVQPERIYVNFETPSGTGIEATDGMIRSVERRIEAAGFKDVTELLSVTGASNNPFDAGASTPNKGSITIEFKEYEDREQSSKITSAEIRDLIEGIPGVDITIKQEEAGPPVGLPVNIEISGEDYQLLGKLAQQIRDEIKGIDGLVDLSDNFDDGKPEIRITVDRQKAGLYGLTTSQIASNIRTAVNGIEASKYRINEDEYDITVRLKKEQRSSIDDVANLKIIYNDKQGKTQSVPLSSIAEVSIDKGPGAIRRKNLDRVIVVTGDAAEGYNANAVLEEVKAKIAGFNLPQGYKISFTGQSEEQEAASAFLGKAFMMAILMIFLILVIQFNSIGQPFIIMTAVIVSLVGVFIGLIAFSMPFGIIMTGIGVISLAGVVVNNNIVLIDYTNVLKRRGLKGFEPIVQAGIRRFRPVTLTALTTVLGLIPLAFGFGFDFYTFKVLTGGASQEFWKSMGIAVIFGLGFATFLTLVLVPVIYSVFEDIPDALKSIGKGKEQVVQTPDNEE